jgi:hypothetical protein
MSNTEYITISHNVLNPTTIIGLAVSSLLKDSTLSETEKNKLLTIQKQADRISNTMQSAKKMITESDFTYTENSLVSTNFVM